MLLFSNKKNLAAKKLTSTKNIFSNFRVSFQIGTISVGVMKPIKVKPQLSYRVGAILNTNFFTLDSLKTTYFDRL